MLPLFRHTLKTKIQRKALRIPLDGLIKPNRCYSIDTRQVCIENYFLSPNLVDWDVIAVVRGGVQCLYQFGRQESALSNCGVIRGVQSTCNCKECLRSMQINCLRLAGHQRSSSLEWHPTLHALRTRSSPNYFAPTLSFANVRTYCITNRIS